MWISVLKHTIRFTNTHINIVKEKIKTTSGYPKHLVWANDLYINYVQELFQAKGSSKTNPDFQLGLAVPWVLSHINPCHAE